MKIDISTLGRLAVFVDGTELAGITAQPIRAALLVYLAVEQDVTRDAALAHIWPDYDQSAARHALSQTLYQLRRDVGNGWFEGRGAYLRATPNLAVDANLFADAVAAGRYVEALNLYRGPFLEACHLAATTTFENWVDRQRARLARLHRKARREYIGQLTAAGDPETALEVSRDWVQLEPLEDEAQQYLIRLLAETGARAEALRQYEDFARILDREDLEPLPETKELVDRLGDAEIQPAPTIPTGAEQSRRDHAVPLAAAASSQRRQRSSALPWIAAAVLVVALVALWLAPLSRGTSDSAARGQIQALAVLPFQNLTADAAEEYFADGMHEALIANLARVSDLKVISRTSVLRYRGTTLSIPQIARDLKVDAVIEGSVLRAGDSLRIQASLIDATAGSTLATVTYVRDLRNVLGLLRDVSRGIAGELAVATTERNEETMPRLVNPAAYEAYLRARLLVHDFQGDSWREATRLYGRAITLDSSFAPAHAGVAQTYFLLGYFGAEPRGEVWPRARETALQAIALDEATSEAYTVLGYLELYEDWNWDGAETTLLQALRLNPNDALARHGYADLLTLLGRGEEGLREVELAREVDPLSPLVNGPVVGHLYITGRFEDALAEIERLRALFDRPDYGQYFVVAALWQLGRYDEALTEFRTLWSHDPGLIRAVEQAYAAGGPQGAMRAAGDYAADGRFPERGDAYEIARYYARADAVDLSLEWLERAYSARKPQFLHAVADPVFDPLRSDPRFSALMRRIGLPPGSLSISAR